jgi:post-segregation antitoxin (ccd killing protein)
VRAPLYDPNAPKQTVSLTLNSDLYAKARSFDINTSRVAEEALAYAVKEKVAAQIRREVAEDIAYWDAFEEQHRAEFDAMQAYFESAAPADAGAAAAPASPSPRRERRR